MTKKNILFFDQVNKNSIDLVGGKGANLGEMTVHGFPVPPGFCITTNVYRSVVNQNEIKECFEELSKTTDYEKIPKIASAIRNKIIKLDLEDVIERDITEAMKRIGEENYFAVRSSATAEDLENASFAGQQDTYLNIFGRDNLLDAVKRCFASLYTDRAVLYRIQNEIPHDHVAMAVVVQKMVLPKVSGIVFTADPISGHRNTISVDAGYGLGEALVSGMVSPDIYKVDKSTLKIIDKKIALKEKAILPLEGGGTETVLIKKEERNKQVLTEKQILKIVTIGIALETHYGVPQDIEWCIDEEELYVVQTRPITSLFPLPEPKPNDNRLHVYVSLNHIQVMTDPISPLGLDIFRNLITLNKETRMKSNYTHTKTAAGRIYLDVSALFSNKLIGKRFITIVSSVDAMLSLAMKSLIEQQDFYEKLSRQSKIKPFKLLKGFPIFIKLLFNLFFSDTSHSVEKMNQFIKEHNSKIARRGKNVNTGTERLDFINQQPSFIEQFANTIFPKLGAGIISLKVLEKIEKKLFNDIKYTPLLAQGLEGNVTTEMGLLIGDLADSIRKSENLIAEFENPDYKSLIERIKKLNGHERFKKDFLTFINLYGFRTNGEIDIATPRWCENPEPLVKNIMTIVKTSKEGTHRKEFKQLIEEANKAAEAFVIDVRENHGKVRAKFVKRLVKVLRANLPLREHHKYSIMKQFMIFKELLLKEGEKLVEKGQLESPQDIFYINMQHLYHGIENGEVLSEAVKEQKECYKHYLKLKPPLMLTSEGEEIKAVIKYENLPDNALVGIPVSSGVVTGIARVVIDPSITMVNKGEILIAKFTDPGWTPLFINAAGLVMEVGGQLTHGSVVAREYGIPAVVSITDATRIIKDGQRITVDGTTGVIQLHEIEKDM